MIDGDKVRKALDELGMSCSQLAAILHVGKSTVSKILSNTYPSIKLVLAVHVAWAVRKHLCSLLMNVDPNAGHEGGVGSAPE